MSREFAAAQMLLNAVELIDQAADPSAAGFAAAIGSTYFRSGTAGIYLKTGAGNLNWQLLRQSFNWKSILDYGADATGVLDSTAALQQAITDVAAQGGGRVFVPAGTFLISQVTVTSSNVQIWGVGSASVLKWTFNAGGAAGSMITISGNPSNVRIEGLRLDGSGLTNPSAGRGNHLIQVGDGVTGAIETQIFRCQFSAMVANSGDGVHVIGAAGNLVSRCWVQNCVFNGCSRFGVGVRQNFAYLWIIENFFTANETDIGCVSNVDNNGDSLIIANNIILHTGAVRHAVRVEGGATTFYTRTEVFLNTIQGGFATCSNVKWGVWASNQHTSGAFASAESVLRVFGNVQLVNFINNIIERETGSSLGPVMSAELSGGAAPSLFKFSVNTLTNAINGGNFVTVVDCTKYQVSSNLCRASNNAGASTAYGIDVQAVTVAVTDCQITGNQITAAAGSFGACVRMLANGANVTDFSIAANQGDQCDYGVRYEIGGGGGTFNGQAFRPHNNWDATTGDLQQVGLTIKDRIGLNASTFGANYWTGAGDPNGAVTARPGSLYSRTDGAQGTAFYYKESGTGNTTWTPVGGSMETFGADDLAAGAGTVFLGPGYITTASATEIQMAITRAATIRNLFVQVATAGTGADTVTHTVRKNGVDTALTTSIANTSTGQASDTTHTFTTSIGDLLSIKVVKGAGVATGQKQVVDSFEVI